MVVSIKFEGFKSAMDDARRVGRVEGVSGLSQNAGDLADGHAPASEPSGQRFAVIVRHRDERLASMVTDPVHGRDVGMIERTGGARLPKQAGRGVTSIEGSGGQELQGDTTLEVRVFGQVTRYPCRQRRCG